MSRLDRVQSLIAEHATEWLREVRANAVVCEARRALTRKPTKTGTIGEGDCLYLRAIVQAVQPLVCAEIGTFIGTSALVLAATGAHVYTCDKDNAAMTNEGAIECYQKTTSTDMLLDLVSRGLSVDLFFFDGRIQPDDLALIKALSHAKTVYAFHDFEGHEKGVVNVERLYPELRRYVLVAPPKHVQALGGKTTIAALERAA